MIKRTYPQSRLRRTRAKSFLRDLVAENHLSTNDLIQPIFISDQSEKTVEIPSMPGIYRHNLDSLYSETEALIKVGIKSVAIFPAIDADKKDQKPAIVNPGSRNKRKFIEDAESSGLVKKLVF